MKARSVCFQLLAQVAAMSLWFVSAAILPEMTKSASLSPVQEAALSSGVQAGFVVGALFGVTAMQRLRKLQEADRQ